MKAISYALFGYNKEKHKDCFSFDSYLCGLMLSLRCNRLVYPDWVNVLNTDESTYQGFRGLFEKLEQRGILKIQRNADGAKLCEAMLWRLKPIFDYTHPYWTYTHVICRDLDSLSTYRDAQAVQMWINNDKGAHAITDSISHDVAMLGGMVGFKPSVFIERTECRSFADLMKRCHIDLSVKGSDQTFLNSFIYPLFATKGRESITQHYFKGHGRTWLNDWHTCDCWKEACRQGHKEGCPLDVAVPISIEMKETNEISEHLGASGWNQQQTMNLIHKYKDKFEDIIEIESEYKHIFYWHR